MNSISLLLPLHLLLLLFLGPAYLQVRLRFEDDHLRQAALTPHAEDVLNRALGRLRTTSAAWPLHFETVLFWHLYQPFLACADQLHAYRLRATCGLADFLQELGLLPKPYRVRSQRRSGAGTRVNPELKEDLAAFFGHFHGELERETINVGNHQVALPWALLPLLEQMPGVAAIDPVTPIALYRQLRDELLRNAAVFTQSTARRRRRGRNRNENQRPAPENPPPHLRLFDGTRLKANRRRKLQLLFLLTVGGHFLQWIDRAGVQENLDPVWPAPLHQEPPRIDLPEELVFGREELISPQYRELHPRANFRDFPIRNPLPPARPAPAPAEVRPPFRDIGNLPEREDGMEEEEEDEGGLNEDEWFAEYYDPDLEHPPDDAEDPVWLR